MSHRPYPSTDRALHQLGRHVDPATPAGLPLPGLTVAEAAANLASWGRRGKPAFDLIDSAYANRSVAIHRRGRNAARAYWAWNERAFLAIRQFDTALLILAGAGSAAAWAYGVDHDITALQWAPAAYAIAWLIGETGTRR